MNSSTIHARARSAAPGSRLNAVVNEVVRASNYDLEEKKIHVEVAGEPIVIEADDHCYGRCCSTCCSTPFKPWRTGRKSGGRRTAKRHGRLSGNPRQRPRRARPNAARKFSSPISRRTKREPASASPSCSRSCWRMAGKLNVSPNEPKGAVFRITHLKLMA